MNTDYCPKTDNNEHYFVYEKDKNGNEYKICLACKKIVK